MVEQRLLHPTKIPRGARLVSVHRADLHAVAADDQGVQAAVISIVVAQEDHHRRVFAVVEEVVELARRVEGAAVGTELAAERCCPVLQLLLALRQAGQQRLELVRMGEVDRLVVATDQGLVGHFFPLGRSETDKVSLLFPWSNVNLSHH